MRAMPNMTEIAPADAIECEAAIRWAADYDGPVYLRLARDAAADVFDDSYQFTPGAVHVLRDGNDVTLVSTGVQTARVLEAAGLLAEADVQARVVHVPMLKPVDDDALLAALDGSRLVLTVEEHTIIGGLGGLVSEVVVGSDTHVRVRRLGLEDAWSESGPSDWLLDKYGLAPARVAERVRSELARLVHG
jgi:transketolase